jgi:hypothetical protein
MWKNIASKVAEKSGVNLMKDVRKKIRLIGRKGVRALFRQNNRNVYNVVFELKI